jgi:hypothetical protein
VTKGHLRASLLNVALLLGVVWPAFFVTSWMWLNRDSLGREAFRSLPAALAYNVIVFSPPLIVAAVLHYGITSALAQRFARPSDHVRSLSVLVSLALAGAVIIGLGADRLTSTASASLLVVAAAAFGCVARHSASRSADAPRAGAGTSVPGS